MGYTQVFHYFPKKNRMLGVFQSSDACFITDGCGGHVGMLRTDCSGETRLLVHEPEIANNIIIIVILSIMLCRSSSNGTAASLPPELVSKPRRRTGDPDNELTHPLLGDEPTLQLMPNRNEVVGIGGRREKKKGFLDWWFSSRPKPMRVSNTTPR